MIPTKTNDITVQSHLDGQKIAMKFDENSLAHIMSVLTDLYSDPELAVIREYSTNALDSHVAAGQTRPIEVTLPGTFNSYFIVQDFGVGMSVNDITEIYSKYGASTKRDTDSQVGMLGLGCKSALTYVSQFTVTAIKNGVKSQVSVGRNEDGTGTMEVVDTVSTDEPNGVKITIPVKNVRSFTEKANNFFKFWSNESVLVNGKSVDYMRGTQVSPNVFMFNDMHMDYIVMGNVAYPVEGHDLFEGRGYYKNFGVVAYVNIGDVNFTPSREALHYTPRTLATIAKVKEDFKTGYHAALLAEIANCDSASKAFLCRGKWSVTLGYGSQQVLKAAVYDGQYVPERVLNPNNLTVFYTNRTRNAVQTEAGLGVSSFDSGVIVTGFSLGQLSAGHKAKTRRWLEENSLPYKTIIFTDGVFGAPWTNDIPTVDFSVIKSTVIKAVTGRSNYGAMKAIPGSYNEVTRNNTIKERDGFTTADAIVYMTTQEKKNFDNASLLTGFLDGATLLVVGLNRLDKFKRDFPQAVYYNTKLAGLKVIADTLLTDDDKIIMNLDWQIKDKAKPLDSSKIDDPDIVKMIDLCQAKYDRSRIDKFNNLFTLLRYTDSRVSSPSVSVKNPFTKYPLYQGQHTAHATIYLNAAYAATNKEN